MYKNEDYTERLVEFHNGEPGYYVLKKRLRKLPGKDYGDKEYINLATEKELMLYMSRTLSLLNDWAVFAR